MWPEERGLVDKRGASDRGGTVLVEMENKQGLKR